MAESHEIYPTRSLAAAILAAAVLVLGILGLSGLVPGVLAAVATITIGVSLALEGGAIARRVPPYAPGPQTASSLRGATATETVSIDATECALTPALGVMIVSHDNPSVADGGETQVIELK